MLKSLLLLVSFVFSLSAQAAIEKVPFDCTLTHAPGSTDPIPGAASYELDCAIYSAISVNDQHSEMNCDLWVGLPIPSGLEAEEPLYRVYEDANTVQFQNGDIMVYYYKASMSARIVNGIDNAECFYKAP